MALGIYSGKDAAVNGITCVQSWQVTPAVTAQRYTASCTPGGTNVSPGISNWTGQMAGVGAHPPGVFPSGSAFTFLGAVNGTMGEGDLLSLTGGAYVEQLTIDINKETAAPISWQATFGFNGSPTEGSSSVSDASEGNPFYGDALDVRIGSSPATIAAASVVIRSAQLVFRRPLTTYVKAGTTHRKPGPLEVDVNFSVFAASMAVAAYLPNTLAKTQIWTSAVDYWQFAELRYLGKTNFAVDRASNAILGYTVNAQWCASKTVDEETTVGHIGYYNGVEGAEDFEPYYGTPE